VNWAFASSPWRVEPPRPRLAGRFSSGSGARVHPASLDGVNALPRLLVVAAIPFAISIASGPALADIVLPDPPVKDAPSKDAPSKDAPVKDAPTEPGGDEAPSADEVLDALAKSDAPGDVPRQVVPPPIDEELMKTLPPPSMGAADLIGPLAKTMLMLCVVLALVYLTLHKGLGKLVERQNSGKRVKVVERVMLDQKRSLFLVEIDGKQMLLAAGEGGVVHLKDVDASTGEARAPSQGSSTGSTGSGSGFGRFADALKSKLPGAQPPVTTGLSREGAAPVTANVTSETKAGGIS
jgi:flagellar protein FliO/FliZ